MEARSLFQPGSSGGWYKSETRLRHSACPWMSETSWFFATAASHGSSAPPRNVRRLTQMKEFMS